MCVAISDNTVHNTAYKYNIEYLLSSQQRRLYGEIICDYNLKVWKKYIIT